MYKVVQVLEVIGIKSFQRAKVNQEVSSSRPSQAFGGGPAGFAILLASGEDFIAGSVGMPGFAP